MRFPPCLLRVRQLFLSIVFHAAICSGCLATANEQTIVEASVQVHVPGAHGSGVAIADHVIATNSHVVEHRHRNDVTVIDTHGQSHSGQTIAIDRSADVALIWCKSRTWRYVRIAPRRPVIGATLRLFGWGPRKQLAWGAGKVVAIWQRNGVEVIDCSVSSVPGDSGGGLFDSDGQLAAINWGGDAHNHYSASTPAEYVRQVAERWVTEALPQDRWQEYACFGGRCAGDTAGHAPGVAPPKWPVSPPRVDSPVQTPPAVIPPASAQIDYSLLAQQIVSQIAADGRFRGPPGEAGPSGPPGLPGEHGPPGPRGPEGQISDDKLRAAIDAAIEARMPALVAKTAEAVRGSVRVRVTPVPATAR